jgi:MFS family permease
MGLGGGRLSFLRWIMAGTLLPGLVAAALMAWVIREGARVTVRRVSLGQALGQMPGRYRRTLVAVGCFGAGDFAHTLLILAASQLLAPVFGPPEAAVLAGLLYVFHNAVYAAAAYPAGHLGDRLGHRRILGLGYALSTLVPLGLILAFARGRAGLPLLAAIFACGGLVSGIKDTLEGAAAAQDVPAFHRGVGFGLLGAVNGAGDLVSSLTVAALWTLHPAWGFAYAAAMMALGAALLLFRGD